MFCMGTEVSLQLCHMPLTRPKRFATNPFVYGASMVFVFSSLNDCDLWQESIPADILDVM
jgi:hypothetical protein